MFPILILWLLRSFVCFILSSNFLLLGFLSVIRLFNDVWFLDFMLVNLYLLLWFNSTTLEFLNYLRLFDDFIIWWHYELWYHCDATYHHIIRRNLYCFLYLLNVDIFLDLQGLYINSSYCILVINQYFWT